MTSQYAVFGNPIAHSLSPLIHRQFAAQTEQNINYERQLVELGGFDEAAASFFGRGGAGLNITAPFKLDAYQFADRLSPRAERAGAVNTLIADNGNIIGDNTDGCGLLADLQHNLHWSISQARVLILGAGGAVRGVIEPLLAANPRSIIIANRSADKAQQLASLFQPQAKSAEVLLTASEYHGLDNSFDIVINATSTSLAGESLAVPTSIFNNALCYDMMYAKTPTGFLQLAVKQGAKSVADGLGMLVEQAAESFRLWRDVSPDTQAVIQSLRESL